MSEFPHVLPTYNRAPLSFDRGEGVWAIAQDGTRYLDLGAGIAGRIRYDQAVTRAQILQKTVVETDAASAQDIRQIWDYLNAQEDALK